VIQHLIKAKVVVEHLESVIDFALFDHPVELLQSEWGLTSQQQVLDFDLALKKRIKIWYKLTWFSNWNWVKVL